MAISVLVRTRRIFAETVTYVYKSYCNLFEIIYSVYLRAIIYVHMMDDVLNVITGSVMPQVLVKCIYYH